MCVRSTRERECGVCESKIEMSCVCESTREIRVVCVCAEERVRDERVCVCEREE